MLINANTNSSVLISANTNSSVVINANTNSSVLISYLEANSGDRRSEKCVAEGSKYAHLTGLYLRFHLNWVLGPFVHGRLQNLQTSEVTFAHVMTALMGYDFRLSSCVFLAFIR